MSAGPATYGFSKYSSDADAAAAVTQALDPDSPRPFTGTPTELPWVGDPLPGARLFELGPSAFSDEPTYVAVSVDGPWIMSAEVQSSLPQAPQVAVQGVADTRANLIAAGLVD